MKRKTSEETSKRVASTASKLWRKGGEIDQAINELKDAKDVFASQVTRINKAIGVLQKCKSPLGSAMTQTMDKNDENDN